MSLSTSTYESELVAPQSLKTTMCVMDQLRCNHNHLHHWLHQRKTLKNGLCEHN